MATTYKIGEAAALLNLKTYVLRFWETEFPHIVPLRTDKGQRLYTKENLALLERIRFLLHERGLTIEGTRKVLNEDKEKGVIYAFTDAANNCSATEDEPAPKGAKSDTDITSQDEDSPDLSADSGNPLSVAGKAVKNFFAQYNLPGISETYPIYDKPLAERLNYLHNNNPPAARHPERLADAPDQIVAGDVVFFDDDLAASRNSLSPRPQDSPRALLCDLMMELEAIAGLLRSSRS